VETKIILTFTDQSGRKQRVEAQTERVTLGRDVGNDIAIDDSNLSRQHAVIEKVHGSIQITDCNSRNGTMVNGDPVVGSVELLHGDIINLAGICEINVQLERLLPPARRIRFSIPRIAVTAVGVILVFSGALLGFLVWSDRATSPANVNTSNQNSRKEIAIAEPSPSSEKLGLPKDVIPHNPELPVDRVVVEVKRVMSKLSNENAPYISDAGINDVRLKIEQYRGSRDLSERFRIIKEGCPEISADAQRINVRPALVMYAALAQSEADNPVAAARKITPKLLSLRATFGTETANSALLLVAAYPYPFNPQIGSQTRTPHPLASKLVEVGGRRSTVETSEARSVWFLREKNAISDEAYDLVIRVLAIGVIAQSPRQYGIDADPPLC
jgi:pSer/pThr/pTyr-binding forkhead associated (FHA) protein